MQPLEQLGVPLDDVARLLIHDLKNKLLLISTNARFIADADTTGDVRDAAADIETASALVDRIIESFCAVAFDPSRAAPKTIAEVPIPPLIGKVTAQVERVRVLPIIATLRARADEALLCRVLRVLIDNATHYAPDGKVDVSARFRDGRVHIKVSDDGATVPTDLVPLVLEPTARFHEQAAKLRVGPVFALAFCKAACANMGGALHVESRAKGAAFVVELAGVE